MRRAAIALLAAAMLTLSGCTLSIYNSYRDIESLEVVQALGLDSAENGGVLLSVATGSDASGKEPVRLKQEAESMDGAMRGLEELAGRGTLFFSGTQAIVLGKEAANEAARWLDAVARSKEPYLHQLSPVFFKIAPGFHRAVRAGAGYLHDVVIDVLQHGLQALVVAFAVVQRQAAFLIHVHAQALAAAFLLQRDLHQFQVHFFSYSACAPLHFSHGRLARAARALAFRHTFLPHPFHAEMPVAKKQSKRAVCYRPCPSPHAALPTAKRGPKGYALRRRRVPPERAA